MILSTNVAETSLTIEGVRAVIDSGLARVAGHSAFSGLPTLATAPISRASAAQRAGRAGRLGPGVCLRLYTKHDHDHRPEHDAPEIAREDLTETRLSIASSGFTLAPSDWFEPPPSAAWQAAFDVLQGLGALDAQGELSALGRRMADKPLHPRLSRLVLEAQTRGAGASGCMLAALLGERDVLASARTRFGGGKARDDSGRSDLVHRLELIETLGDDLSPSRLRAHDLDPGAVHAATRVRERLVKLFDDAYDDHSLDDHAREEALLIATCAAFFDRVAKRRTAQGSVLVFARGGSASLAETSVVRDAEYVVVVDAREKKGGKSEVVAYLASAIEPEWLLELFPQRITDRTQLTFDSKTERISSLQVLAYDGLTLDSATHSDVSGPEVTQLLVQAATERGLAEFVDLDAVSQLRARSVFAASVDPSLAPLPEDAVQRALLHAAEGKRSFAELRATRISRAPSAGGWGASKRARSRRWPPIASRCREGVRSAWSTARAVPGSRHACRTSSAWRGPDAGPRPRPSGARAARAQPARGAGHHGSRGLLGQALPGDRARAPAPLSAPQLARRSHSRRTPRTAPEAQLIPVSSLQTLGCKV